MTSRRSEVTHALVLRLQRQVIPDHLGIMDDGSNHISFTRWWLVQPLTMPILNPAWISRQGLFPTPSEEALCSLRNHSSCIRNFRAAEDSNMERVHR